MQVDEILAELKQRGNPQAVAGMARYGIQGKVIYGVSIPTLRKLAHSVGQNHDLALKLWDSRVHEARILASMVDPPVSVTDAQMENWVADFDSWDLCDQCCNNLFKKTPFAYDKANHWSGRDEEFVKRAGFVMMAVMAVFDKKAPDARFEQFFPLIIEHATDGRNFVKKAVNWALRQIGKRNLNLNAGAIAAARQIQAIDSPAARWIANDALRELNSIGVQERLKKKAK